MFFFFKQKTAYEMRISDWSSDVCSSDLDREHAAQRLLEARNIADRGIGPQKLFIGFALHLDEVGHLHRFVDIAEQLADSLARGCFEGLAHRLRLGRHK